MDRSPNPRRQRKAAALLGLAGIVSICIGLVPTAAGAASVAPQQRSGNPTCGSLGYASEFKIDGINGAFNGTYNNGTLTISNSTSNSFDFTSTVRVSAVFVKAANGGNLYDYLPAGTLGDTNLVTPDRQGISHVSFCYGGSTTTSSSTTSSSTTSSSTTSSTSTSTTSTSTTSTTQPTTTTAPTTTTTAAPTTTTAAPTTTAPATTDTTLEEEVLGEVITRDTTATTVAAAPTTAAAAVLGVQVTRPDTLPRTGNDPKDLLVPAGIALLMGSVLTVASSRSEASATR